MNEWIFKMRDEWLDRRFPLQRWHSACTAIKLESSSKIACSTGRRRHRIWPFSRNGCHGSRGFWRPTLSSPRPRSPSPPWSCRTSPGTYRKPLRRTWCTTTRCTLSVLSQTFFESHKQWRKVEKKFWNIHQEHETFRRYSFLFRL